MSHCVLDASIALAWVLPTEIDAGDLLENVVAMGAVVPGLWALEVGHVLLTAERKGRIAQIEKRRALELLSTLPISIDTDTARHAWSKTLSFAESHALSFYDASYLEWAVRLALPLASRDARLIRAASACDIAVLS